MKIFSYRLLLVFLPLLLLFVFPQPVAADIVFDNTICSGTFICKKKTMVCTPVGCDPTQFGCTCEDVRTTENRTCWTDTGSNTCHVPTTGCNDGYDLAGCTMSFPPRCGDNSCNGGESCATCPGDCACGTVCGNSSCETGENCSNCPSDCPTGCTGGTCSGSCMAPAANCGAYGMAAGSGTCINGQLCCTTPPAEVCNCCYDGDWASGNTVAGYCQDGYDEWNKGGMAGLRHQCERCGCPRACGQNPGEGDLCPTTDKGAPNCPTVTADGGGQNYALNTNGTVTIDWNQPSKADSYQIRIYPTGADCTSPYAICPASTQTARTYTFYPDANAGAYYTIEIRALNNTCSLEYSAWCSTSITIMANINVNFYLDNTAQATPIGGICQLSGATATNPGSGATLTAQGQFSSYPGTINGMTATIAAPYWPPVANNVITLTPGEWQPGSQYRCTCPSGCQYSGIASPQNGINFFLAAIDLTHTGWWQVKGGLIYDGQMTGTALNDPIPVMSCEAAAPACIPAMITKDKDNTEGSAGIAITGGGGIDSSDEQGSQTGYVTDRASQAFAVGTAPRNRENYDYFYRQYSMGTNPGASDDFTATANDARKPTGEPLGDKRAYFHEGDLTIQNQWSVGSNEQVVIFVHGNLTIADPAGVESLMDVTEGGFLAFIVSGNITIESSVGNADLDSLSSNVEGVFIADGTLRVESKGAAAGGDQRFIGEGTFVGWSGVVLERDFSDGGMRKAENNTKPAEMFIYRPDFVKNVPERMAKPVYVWQETN